MGGTARQLPLCCKHWSFIHTMNIPLSWRPPASSHCTSFILLEFVFFFFHLDCYYVLNSLEHGYVCFCSISKSLVCLRSVLVTSLTVGLKKCKKGCPYGISLFWIGKEAEYVLGQTAVPLAAQNSHIAFRYQDILKFTPVLLGFVCSL